MRSSWSWPLSHASRAQEALRQRLACGIPADETDAKVESAWLDLRQTTSANSKPQAAPDWVEAVTTIPSEAKEGVAPKTVFRIRLSRPRADFQVLFFRLFFDDQPDQATATGGLG